MSAIVERFAALAGFPTPQWPSGRPRRQSARERRIVYGTRTTAARFEVVGKTETGRPVLACNRRTLDIARPAQTRGTSRIPDQQDIAHAIGAVAAGSPDRPANPIGAAMLWDWCAAECAHPWVPSRAYPLVIDTVMSGRRAPRLDARTRVFWLPIFAKQGAIDAYVVLATGRSVAAPDWATEDADHLRLFERLSRAAFDLLTSRAEDAARDALALLR